MATKEAVAQLAALPERVAVVEIKVEAINEKLSDIKSDVKEMHDCLDQTRDLLDKKLCEMSDASDRQHSELAAKIGDLEKVKNKWQQYVMILLAFGAGTGWLGHVNAAQLLKFLGL
jgi:predicted  nucleic acid-binding Zn-ribbon protein